MKSQTSPYDFLVASATPQRGNVTASVTDSLRQAIVTLELKPGETLDKGAICERLGVSRFPVSEALARLQAEGLVDILPQRGSMVSLVRIADVREYMLIRKALESEAVRVLIGNHTDALIDALRFRVFRSPRHWRACRPRALWISCRNAARWCPWSVSPTCANIC